MQVSLAKFSVMAQTTCECGIGRLWLLVRALKWPERLEGGPERVVEARDAVPPLEKRPCRLRLRLLWRLTPPSEAEEAATEEDELLRRFRLGKPANRRSILNYSHWECFD